MKRLLPLLVLAGNLLPASAAEEPTPPRNPFDLGWTGPLDVPGPFAGADPYAAVADAVASQTPLTAGKEAGRAPPAAAAAAPKAGAWSGALRLMGGYDTNISQEPLVAGKATGHTGSFVQLVGTGAWRFFEREGDNLNAGATGSWDDYPGHERYRFRGVGPSLTWNHAAAPWLGSTTAGWTRYWLGPEPAAQVGTGSVTVGHLDLPGYVTLFNGTVQWLQYHDNHDSSGIASALGCHEWFMLGADLQERFELGLQVIAYQAGESYQSYLSLAPGAAFRTRFGGAGAAWRFAATADIDARRYRAAVPNTTDRLDQALVLVRLELMRVLGRGWEAGFVASHTQRLTHFADSEYVRQQFALALTYSP